MKKLTGGFFISCIIMSILFSACKDKSEVDPMILPSIVFKKDAGYTSKDTTVAAGTTLLTGINAAKTEPNDVLKIFAITRSYDGGGASGVYNENLSGTQGDNYSKDYTITTRITAGTEKYTYNISNRDGLVNYVTLTVTTQ